MAYHYASRRTMGRRPSAPARKMGTWKIAYADFLTALMAFFLVMWMVTGVSAEDRAELAEYFGGDPAAVEAAATRFEADTVSADIAKALSEAVASGHVSIAETGETLRIEVMDRTGRPLFDAGSGAFNEDGEALLGAVSAAIAGVDAPMSLEGHTDAFPSLVDGYSNWELSTDRANAARRLLVEYGVESARIQAVSGLAATAPLNAGEPHLSANRRVSIVLSLGESE